MSEIPELPPVPNFKHLLTIVWIAIATAIVVTIIDWKIKNDILNSARDFYLAMGKEVPDGKREQTNGRSRAGTVLPLSVVDSHPRMEARVPAEPAPVPSRFAVPDPDGDSDTGTVDDSAPVPEEPLGVER